MTTLLVGGAVATLCSNITIVKIVASVGVIMHIAKIKQGKDIAVGAGIIYIVSNIIRGVL